MDIFLVYSIRQLHVFVLIRASLQKLRSIADLMQFEMLLDEEKLRKVAEAGNDSLNIAPINISHEPEETEIRPHEYITGSYRKEIDEDMYWRPDDITHPFRESIRLKLTLIIIEMPPPCGTGSIKVR